MKDALAALKKSFDKNWMLQLLQISCWLHPCNGRSITSKFITVGLIPRLFSRHKNTKGTKHTEERTKLNLPWGHRQGFLKLDDTERPLNDTVLLMHVGWDGIVTAEAPAVTDCQHNLEVSLQQSWLELQNNTSSLGRKKRRLLKSKHCYVHSSFFACLPWYLRHTVMDLAQMHHSCGPGPWFRSGPGSKCTSAHTWVGSVKQIWSKFKPALVQLY